MSCVTSQDSRRGGEEKVNRRGFSEQVGLADLNMTLQKCKKMQERMQPNDQILLWV